MSGEYGETADADVPETSDILDDEDIAALEDKPEEEAAPAPVAPGGVIVRAAEGEFPPDTPVYRLQLSYSNETFRAAYRGEELHPGDVVLVPTHYGRDLATIVSRARCPASGIARIERPASADERAQAERNKSQEEEAFRVCSARIEARRLNMKLVSVHCLLEEAKLLFFFTSDNRVDFRELVKDLAAEFRTRIELRQIGVRDEARVMGGLGVCGRDYCCRSLSEKPKAVSIRMAKDQNLPLNSMKISGPCGRLMCCLSYEHCFYSEQLKLVPREGTRIHYEGTEWRVREVNIITGRIMLRAEDDRILILPFNRFEKKDIRWSITPL